MVTFSSENHMNKYWKIQTNKTLLLLILHIISSLFIIKEKITWISSIIILFSHSFFLIFNDISHCFATSVLHTMYFSIWVSCLCVFSDMLYCFTQRLMYCITVQTYLGTRMKVIFQSLISEINKWKMGNTHPVVANL